jgi:hypothetical protein
MDRKAYVAAGEHVGNRRINRAVEMELAGSGATWTAAPPGEQPGRSSNCSSLSTIQGQVRIELRRALWFNSKEQPWRRISHPLFCTKRSRN